MHFWRPVKENTVVLQLSIEVLPNTAVTVVQSHCFGNEPLPWFLSKLSILCSAATIPWNGCCGWRKSADRSEWRKSRADDVNVVLKGSFRCACTEWELLATPAWPGHRPIPVGTLSHQSRINMHIYGSRRTRRRPVCDPLSENMSERYWKWAKRLNLTGQDNGLFEIGSEKAYQSAATVTALVGWNLAAWEFPFSLQQWRAFSACWSPVMSTLCASTILHHYLWGHVLDESQCVLI